MDCFDRGRWPGRQGPPASLSDLTVEAEEHETAVVAAAMRDAARTVSDRVQIAKDWLTSGVIPLTYLRAPYTRADRLWWAFKYGNVQIDEKRAPGQIVDIVSGVEGALQFGYRFAPAVVSLDPLFAFQGGARGSKFTIGQYRQGYANLDDAVIAHPPNSKVAGADRRRSKGRRSGGLADLIAALKLHPAVANVLRLGHAWRHSPLAQQSSRISVRPRHAWATRGRKR